MMKVIIEEDKITKAIKKGLEHLKFNPFLDGSIVVINRMLSINKESCLWFFYSLYDNTRFIKETEGGDYLIDALATPFITVHSMEDFIQINAKNISFNHYKALNILHSE